LSIRCDERQSDVAAIWLVEPIEVIPAHETAPMRWRTEKHGIVTEYWVSNGAGALRPSQAREFVSAITEADSLFLGNLVRRAGTRFRRISCVAYSTRSDRLESSAESWMGNGAEPVKELVTCNDQS
jgi:hypothetical protein